MPLNTGPDDSEESKADDEDDCSLPAIQPGAKKSCRAFLTRWTFNDGACQQITYGGCGGTKNLFETEYACNAKCNRKGTVALIFLSKLFGSHQFIVCQLCFEDRVLDPANPHLLRATYRRLPVIAVLTSPVFTLIRYPVNANRLSTPDAREMQTIFFQWKTAVRPARSGR